VIEVQTFEFKGFRIVRAVGAYHLTRVRCDLFIVRGERVTVFLQRLSVLLVSHHNAPTVAAELVIHFTDASMLFYSPAP
jgi:hypothetical protein